jgi:hypothetical protein
MRITSILFISTALSSYAFAATLTSDNLDYTRLPLPYTLPPATSDPIDFPPLTLTNGTAAAGNLHYYFGNSGAATSGLTKNKGLVTFTAGSISDDTTAIPGTFTYTPADRFYGFDTFDYRIHDSSDNVDTPVYTVTLRVGGPLNVVTSSQDIPFALTPAAAILSNFTAAGGAWPYTYAVTDLPTYGTLTQDDDSIVLAGVPLMFLPLKYTPNALYYGLDPFRYTIIDSAGTPAMLSGQFDVYVQAQGFSTVPGEEITAAAQITGSKILVVDGGGTLTLDNTKPDAQNDFSGGTYINDTTVIVKSSPFMRRTIIDLR